MQEDTDFIKALIADWDSMLPATVTMQLVQCLANLSDIPLMVGSGQDSTARIPQPGLHSQDSTARGFHNQDCTASSPPPGSHSQDSTARAPPPGFRSQDSKENSIWGRALGSSALGVLTWALRW